MLLQIVLTLFWMLGFAIGAVVLGTVFPNGDDIFSVADAYAILYCVWSLSWMIPGVGRYTGGFLKPLVDWTVNFLEEITK